MLEPTQRFITWHHEHVLPQSQIAFAALQALVRLLSVVLWLSSGSSSVGIAAHLTACTAILTMGL